MTVSEKPVEIDRITLFIQRISIARWTITLLLSLRGIYAFYGMKEKGSLEQFIIFITDPVVGIFKIESVGSYAIPGISVLFAVVSILLASYIAQFIFAKLIRWSESGAQAKLKTYP